MAKGFFAVNSRGICNLRLNLHWPPALYREFTCLCPNSEVCNSEVWSPALYREFTCLCPNSEVCNSEVWSPALYREFTCLCPNSEVCNSEVWSPALLLVSQLIECSSSQPSNAPPPPPPGEMALTGQLLWLQRNHHRPTPKLFPNSE